MKAENGCGDLQQGYCSFPLHLLSKGVSDLMRGKDICGVLMMPLLSPNKWRCSWNQLLEADSLFTDLHLKFQVCTLIKRNSTPCEIKGIGSVLWTVNHSELPVLYVSVSQRWVLLAGKSFRKPSVHFHSSFQQCEWCDSLLGQGGLLRSGLPWLYAFGPGSQARPVCSSSPPVPYRAAHQAHREQRGTRDPSNCQCFGQLSGNPAWRGPPVPKLSQCSPLNPHSDTYSEDDISALRVYIFRGYPQRRAETCEFLSLQHGLC